MGEDDYPMTAALATIATLVPAWLAIAGYAITTRPSDRIAR
jgi:hypothetical protein